MSELHCPNCNYLIGRLDVAKEGAGGAVADVKEWMGVTSWSGWENPAALYGRYRNWAVAAGRDALSQRRFSAAAIAAGAVWRSTKQGRVYAPPAAV